MKYLFVFWKSERDNLNHASVTTADWGCDPDEQKSTLGYAFMLRDGTKS